MSKPIAARSARALLIERTSCSSTMCSRCEASPLVCGAPRPRAVDRFAAVGARPMCRGPVADGQLLAFGRFAVGDELVELFAGA